MATRKKKDPGTVSGFPKSYPYVVVGTHLTVTEHEDGRTQLTWDDAALLREVQEAIRTWELSQLKPAVRAKSRVRKVKNHE
jgi:hypothetical protein